MRCVFDCRGGRRRSVWRWGTRGGTTYLWEREKGGGGGDVRLGWVSSRCNLWQISASEGLTWNPESVTGLLKGSLREKSRDEAGLVEALIRTLPITYFGGVSHESTSLVVFLDGP